MALNTRENPTAERINGSSVGSPALQSLRAQLRALACALAVSTPFLVAGCNNPNQQQAAPAVDAKRAQNVVGNSMALWLCETILDEIKQENWERKQADVKNHITMLEESLKDSNAKISEKVGALNKEIDKKADKAFIQKMIEEILEELKKDVEALANEEVQIDQRVEGIEKLFGYFPTVPPSPLLRTSLEGEPEAHPLTVKWMKLLSESETHRIQLEELNRIYRPNAPQMQQAMTQLEKLQQDASALHLEVKTEMAKKLVSRTKLLVTMKETHPEVQNFDRNISSLAWLVAITKPAATGRYAGTLDVPEDLVGPYGSDILAAFQISGFKPDDVAPLYRKLVRLMPVAGAGPGLASNPLPDNLAKTEENFLSIVKNAQILQKEISGVDAQLKELLKDHSNLDPKVIDMEKKKAALLKDLQKLNAELNVLVNTAIKDYVNSLETLRPSHSHMMLFNARVIQPAQDLYENSFCFDWKNQISRNETWDRSQIQPASISVPIKILDDRKLRTTQEREAAIENQRKKLAAEEKALRESAAADRAKKEAIVKMENDKLEALLKEQKAKKDLIEAEKKENQYNLEKNKLSLSIGNEKERSVAAKYFYDYRDPAILPFLRQRLSDDPDPEVKIGIAVAIVKIGGEDRNAIAVLKKGLYENPWVAKKEIPVIREHAGLLKTEITSILTKKPTERPILELIEELGPNIASAELHDALISIIEKKQISSFDFEGTILALVALGNCTEADCDILRSAYLRYWSQGVKGGDLFDTTYANALGKLGPVAKNHTKELYQMMPKGAQQKAAAQEALVKILTDK